MAKERLQMYETDIHDINEHKLKGAYPKVKWVVKSSQA